MSQDPLNEAQAALGARWSEDSPDVACHFGDPQGEYEAALQGAAIHVAGQRGLVEITGRDRATWLNNLVTNAVRDLQPGDGSYSFATNVQGRIVLDFNVLMLTDAIWLDIDRRLIPKSLKHFDRYIISEDVQCLDRSDEWRRIVLLGPKTLEIAEALGATHAALMAALSSTTVPLAGKQRLMVRHDHLAGVFGLELYISAADDAGCWTRLLEIGRPIHLRPAGSQAVLSLRMEAGISQYGLEIDEEVLPAETGQMVRAVSHVKGCYLGQEVIERMRSHKVTPPRRLVGLSFSADPGRVAEPLALLQGETVVGRLMNTCFSHHVQGFIGLAYVRTAIAQPETKLTVQNRDDLQAQIVALPWRSAGE